MADLHYTISDRFLSVLKPGKMSANRYFNPVRFFQTIRHLKACQIFYRLWYKYQRPVPLEDLVYSCTPCLKKPIFINKPESFDYELTFSFLGHRVSFADWVDWTCKDKEPLWAFNLHYFDFINSRDSTPNDVHQIIKHWISENKVYSKPGWASYPTSLRIVNWIKFELNNSLFTTQELDSLFHQCRFLSLQIEYDILANHLIANAKALLFGGLFFNSFEAKQWLEKGLLILDNQLKEQINEDGAHFELSPMYHAILLEDLIDIYVLLSAFGHVSSDYTNDKNKFSEYCDEGIIPTVTTNTSQCDLLIEGLERVIPRMLHFLETVTHPDGELSFFNDSAMGIAPSYLQLINHASKAGMFTDSEFCNSLQTITHSDSNLALKPIDLKPVSNGDNGSSGYKKSSLGEFTLITNVAPISPSYQPSHAHADTLSFELSFKQQRILVNSGTSTYSVGELRQMQRSTRAHNTLVIDGHNSSDVWAAFRVGKRARILEYFTEESEKNIRILGSHDGYKSWRGGVTHKREWVLEQDKLTCSDSLDGHYSSAELYFHFHPDVSLVSGNVLKTTDGNLFKWISSELELNWVESHWYPRFGEKEKNICLQISLDSRISGHNISNQLCLIS